ncbi:MAG: non-canonical purine NTP pyrophosphatase, partial [Gammaproteobacteria bacterium]|nr:non-canonical purine NTP pyrophosphatase [Gammaproteobacteria bacterium]
MGRMVDNARIVLATGNKGKVREIGKLLATLQIEVMLQSHWQVPEAEETGLT